MLVPVTTMAASASDCASFAALCAARDAAPLSRAGPCACAIASAGTAEAATNNISGVMCRKLTSPSSKILCSYAIHRRSVLENVARKQRICNSNAEREYFSILGTGYEPPQCIERESLRRRHVAAGLNEAGP